MAKDLGIMLGFILRAVRQMQLIRGLHNLSRFDADFVQGCVLTIGNFDGVHCGHQQVLRQLVQKSKKMGLPSVVMVFEPLPIEFFAPDKAPVRLMNLREKVQAFKCTGIDYVLVCRFDAAFAHLTAEAFIRQVLVAGLRVKQLVVGDDFQFGYQRQGDFTTLQLAGRSLGFEVSAMPTFGLVEAGVRRVSSTWVRQALAQMPPDLAMAERLLCRPFSFHGRVIHGRKLGRKIGFRTLNLNPKRHQMPVQGVFAVTVTGIADRPWEGVANIGIRPTVKGNQPSIEVHLLNWQKEVYGAHVEVFLQHFIRPEMKFGDLEDLVQQIRQDVRKAKQFFNGKHYD